MGLTLYFFIVFYLLIYVFGQEVDAFDICDKCNWQNGEPNEKEIDLSGPNKYDLKESKRSL